jgi:hypothetical protein
MAYLPDFAYDSGHVTRRGIVWGSWLRVMGWAMAMGLVMGLVLAF